MSEHADTALDQLRLADSCDNDRAGEHLGFLAAAVVHAVLALAEEVRRAQPPMYQLPQVQKPPTAAELAAFKEAVRTHVPRPI